MRATVFGCVLMVFGLISCASPSTTPAQVAAVPSATPAPTPTEVLLPECATPLPELPPQPELEGFPLPPTTRMMQRFEMDSGHLIFSGVAAGKPDDSAAFLESNLPTAGYIITASDSEPGEADGSFTKANVNMNWHIIIPSDCPTISVFQIIINPD